MGKKIVFLGTPDIACPFLRELAQSGFEISAVITMPDKKAGRGLTLMCPAVKTEGENLNIPVYQPKSPSELYSILQTLSPDLGVVVAYGRILKKEVLESVPLGFINAHFSLLPKYRGAAPVRHAILNGEKETGMTVFKIDEGMDTGPVILQKKIQILPQENSISLFNRLAQIGKIALKEAVSAVLEGKVRYIPQQGEVSYAPKIEAKDTFLDFRLPYYKIYDAIRAFCFDPRARFFSPSCGLIQIISALYHNKDFTKGEPGILVSFEKGKGIFIKCGEGAVLLEKIKPEGKKEINAYDFFINGKRMKEGDKIADERR
ncbi:MAG: methionyl-tRNA formyltransferase [Elusimicrobia bacterium]|nr:methionyl-tRNA formyltransferase [Elusimicrobiota bacterium]